MPSGDALELIARHHGLPSPILDWTRSPYVASCFAFLDADIKKNPNICIFALDRSKIDPNILEPIADWDSPQIETIDNLDLLQFNRRAVQQRGVFLRISTGDFSVEELLGVALTKFILPASDKDAALKDLDQMLLNPTMLMYDLDGAARTAAWRLSQDD